MYYSHSCSYCTKIFYIYHNNKEHASRLLYVAIKSHLIEYDEDHKEYKFDDGIEADSDEIYYKIIESNDAPPGGYEVS